MTSVMRDWPDPARLVVIFNPCASLLPFLFKFLYTSYYYLFSLLSLSIYVCPYFVLVLLQQLNFPSEDL